MLEISKTVTGEISVPINKRTGEGGFTWSGWVTADLHLGDEVHAVSLTLSKNHYMKHLFYECSSCCEARRIFRGL